MNNKNTRNFEIGGYSHTYARGCDKRVTFLDNEDYERFQKYLILFNTEKYIKTSRLPKKLDLGKPIVEIDCYVLMPNHYHINQKEIIEGGISKFMHKVASGYTAYFNKKYKREGSLFSSKYRLRHIKSDSYLYYIRDYIKYNPLKLIRPHYNSKELAYGELILSDKEKKFIKDYKYSSFHKENDLEYLSKKFFGLINRKR